MPRMLLLLALLAFAGCDSGTNQPAFAELHPVRGTVMRGGKPVAGGAVQFAAAPEDGSFMINSDVLPDGTFQLSTVRTTDTQGERKTGAPAGSYRVTYMPVVVDQTAGNVEPITLNKEVTVEAKDNDLTIELPR